MISEKDLNELKKSPITYGESLNINKLVELMKYLSDKYYNEGISIVSDEVYDVLKDILHHKDPKNKYLKEIGAVIRGAKVKLPYFMGSLDKIKPDLDNLTKFTEEYPGKYVLSDKLDGVSALLHKKNDNLKLYSRGDGIDGQDISKLIKYVLNIDNIDIKEGYAIRGELIITKNDFKKIENKMANARNAVAGLVNSKNIDIDVAKITKFVAYSIINPLMKQDEQMKELKKMGFQVVPYKIEKDLTMDKLNNYLIERRKESIYDIDGIVIADSSKEYENQEGNPKHSYAFKAVLTDQIAEAIVEDVLWEPSKNGLLKPRIKIRPVKLLGTTITYTTGFNAKFIFDNKINVGTIIKLVKSGDVIPYVDQIIKPSKEPKMPDIQYQWNDTQVDIIMKSQDKQFKNIVKIKRIVFFFKTIGAKFIDEGFIKKLVDNGFNSIPKILEANFDDLSNIDGIGNKLILKIFNSIQDAFNNSTLEKLMAASHLFGTGMGEKKIKLIIDKIPNIMTIKIHPDQLKDIINNINGFSHISTNKFVDNLDKFKQFFDIINDIYDIEYLKKPIKSTKIGNIFDHKTIVFTGFRDNNLEKFVIDNGGKISNSVSSKTYLVVAADINEKSTKLDKARDNNINIISKNDFVNLYIKSNK